MQYSFEQQLTVLKRNQKLLIILILFFVIVMVWTFVSLFTTQKTTVTSPELVKLATPLSPALDTEALENLTTKRAFSEEELEHFPIFKIITTTDNKTEVVVPIETTIEEFTNRDTPLISPTPAPTVIPVATQSGLIN